MVREPLKLLFLIISYNFILSYASGFLPILLFPLAGEDILLLLSYNSALYLAWLFGYRERTVVLLAYVYLFQVIGLALLRRDYYTIGEFFPSLLLTLFLVWLFESPVERRTRALEEERTKLEQELTTNEQEISRLFEQMSLLKEIIDRLHRERKLIEREYARLRQEEENERELLEKEKEELSKKLQETQKRLQEYTERLEKLTCVNRELFEMLQALQEKEQKYGNEKLSKLRQERKRLSKEIIHLYEFLEELSKENQEIRQEREELKNALNAERKEKELLKLEVEQLRASQEGKKEIYREIFSVMFDNLEVEERALKDFLQFNRELKKEFLKELLLLNMKNKEERFESMKGYKNVFKLKPRGGRIYFTFGEDKTWKVLGMLRGEDDKLKERYTGELLLKFKI